MEAHSSLVARVRKSSCRVASRRGHNYGRRSKIRGLIVINVVLVMFFQAAAGQAAAPPAETPQTTVTVTADAPAEVKQSCKWVYDTGSRIKKVKVCKTNESASNNGEQSQLMRQLDRGSDISPPQATGAQ